MAPANSNDGQYFSHQDWWAKNTTLLSAGGAGGAGGGNLTSSLGAITNGKITVGQVMFDSAYTNIPPRDVHNDKGVCQESYDQGYLDGLEAAKNGDTRVP